MSFTSAFESLEAMLLSVVDSCAILTEEDLFLVVSLIAQCLLEYFLFLLSVLLLVAGIASFRQPSYMHSLFLGLKVDGVKTTSPLPAKSCAKHSKSLLVRQFKSFLKLRKIFPTFPSFRICPMLNTITQKYRKRTN